MEDSGLSRNECCWSSSIESKTVISALTDSTSAPLIPSEYTPDIWLSGEIRVGVDIKSGGVGMVGAEIE